MSCSRKAQRGSRKTEIKAATQTEADCVFTAGKKRTNSPLSLTLLSKTDRPLIFRGTEPKACWGRLNAAEGKALWKTLPMLFSYETMMKIQTAKEEKPAPFSQHHPNPPAVSTTLQLLNCWQRTHMRWSLTCLPAHPHLLKILFISSKRRVETYL